MFFCFKNRECINEEKIKRFYKKFGIEAEVEGKLPNINIKIISGYDGNYNSDLNVSIETLNSEDKIEFQKYLTEKNNLRYNNNIMNKKITDSLNQCNYQGSIQIYDEIKELREEFRKTNQKVWSNLTISIKNDRITYTFCYDNLLGGQDEYYDHHIYWRKKYLHIEPCGKKEEKAFNKYLSTRNLEVPKSDEYITGIYLKRQVNVVKYDTTDVDENQRVDYRVAKQEESKIKNQILCNK